MYSVPNIYKPESTHALGTFDVTSGKLVVSDPCYNPGIWCQGNLENVKNGRWHGFVVRGKTDWGNRCWEVYAMHDECSLSTAIAERTDIDVGVDSGQAGIFDYSQYHGGEDDYGDGGWYDLCCQTTLSKPHSAGVVPGGVVSSSGFGDGGYTCEIAKNDDGQIVGVKITFICQEDFENDDSDEDYWGEDEDEEDLN